ncbi:MAG: symmetrical bis(5'-nucleosyl)-tetraphosphatase [Betaproteobacteria bacterium]|nr:symmetrical bis(5'-nucleosyl)-tetraphosphatase [Betaproteobacteria bacterium]
MATYAIGDVQGCYEPLRRLLDRIRFDPANDRLWFAGDIVNRGPHTLEVLRFVRGLGNGAVTVLGNHDLHLLVVAAGVRSPHHGDTLDSLLAAPDRDELLDWLRRRPLLHAEADWAMVHAGLLPQWSITQARALSAEVEAMLQGPQYCEFLQHMYGNKPRRWSDDLEGFDRLRVVVNAMTRLRLSDDSGAMEFSHKSGPQDLPKGYRPWFDSPQRASAGTPIIFGHWASLGLLLREDIVCLDSGCVWGRSLTAIRLEDRALFQCDCSEIRVAGGE